ncbi:MAG: adenylate/guanylate cyclase domain-containing protein [Candidatus Riflebacteria bacterium]|nr:adenylate/guanylate cyclase domain-containing protein [Candidatus Riflebacteria bacterium]
MNKKWVFLFLCLLMILFIPSVFDSIDFCELEKYLFLPSEIDQDEIFSFLKEIRRQDNLETQLGFLTRKYLDAKIKRNSKGNLLENCLALPPKDLFLLRLQGESWKTLYRETQLKKISSKEAGDLASLSQIPSKKFPDSSEIISSFSRNLSKKLNFPYSAVLQVPEMDGRIVFINSPGNRKIFFWETYRIGKSYVDIIVALYDLEGMGNDFSEQMIVSNWKKYGMALGFIANDKGKPILGDSFDGNPKLKDHLIQISIEGKKIPATSNFEGVELFCSQSLAKTGYRPVIAVLESQIERNRLFQVVFGSSLVIFFYLLGNFSIAKPLNIFSRSIIASVVLRLFGAAIVPIFGAVLFFNLTLSELGEKARNDLKNSLHDSLVRLDEGSKYSHNLIFQKIVETIRDKNFLERIKNIRSDKDPIGFLREMSNHLVSDILDPRNKNEKNTFLNVISLKASDSFAVTWKKPKDNFLAEKGDEGENYFAILQNLVCHNLIRKIGDSTDTKFNKNSSFLLKMEIILDVLINLIGSENLMLLVQPARRISTLRINSSKYFITQNVIEVGPANPYFLFWAWDEFLTSRPYLLKQFANQPKSLEIFAAPRPLIGIEEGYPLWFNKNLLYSNNKKMAELYQLVLASYEANDMIQAYTTSEKGKISDFQEALPGKDLSQYILIGNVSMKDSETFLKTEETNFFATIAIMLILAVIAVFFMVNSMLQPLKEIQDAMKKITENDYKVSLKVQGTDEIGKIMRAFNKMTALLAQGKLLGYYVSEFVRKAVSDENFRKGAIVGEDKEVTVVFSQIKDFQTVQANLDAEFSLEIMKTQFEAFKKSTEIFGGEIDKVFENKILVVFDHILCGGGESAVKAALKTIFNVQDRVRSQNSGIQLAMGVNSGKVIAGIVGAQKSRLTYTVIGDTVNVAARLASLAEEEKTESIMASGISLSLLKNRKSVEIIRTETKKVKGKSSEVEVFQIANKKRKKLNT